MVGNKTYHQVRSFGKDLSNLQQQQQFQEAKLAYGEVESTKAIGLHQQPKILRVKSQIGTS